MCGSGVGGCGGGVEAPRPLACAACASNSVSSSAPETEVNIYSASKGRAYTHGFICAPSWRPVLVARGEPFPPS